MMVGKGRRNVGGDLRRKVRRHKSDTNRRRRRHVMRTVVVHREEKALVVFQKVTTRWPTTNYKISSHYPLKCGIRQVRTNDQRILTWQQLIILSFFF